MRVTSTLPAAMIALMLSATFAMAHAVLVRSDPGSGGILSPDDLELRLTFNDVLEPQFSTFKIEAVDGDDTAVSVSFQEGGKSAVLRLQGKLRPGSYRVHWRVVSTDTHRSEGVLPFSVR